jgi:hypothetical protein
MPFGNGYGTGISPGPATPPRPAPSRTVPGTGMGATQSLALDNMIRNTLKVSDPRDARQIAAGLLAYYRDLPQAVGIRQEAEGLPFLASPVAPPIAPPQASSSDAEFRIANGDVERALQDLATNPLANDITPEMQGWGDSLRIAIVQGQAAARQGLDPTQRDKVMAIRRQLGEYGRMARFVGALVPGMTQNFRRLGQAMDEVAAVLLVMLGESLASVGFASGYYLLQVPLAEVQQRRDAVIFALRNFMGGTQLAYGPDDWPRGIDAYRRLYRWLEEQGQGDLRSLLLENDVAQAMDALITRAQNGTPEGLRALGVTAQLDLERFRRMAIVAPGAMSHHNGVFDRSPPLESYLQALELFAETFQPAGGLRLLRIARPPVLFYGIYNPSLLEDDRELVDLIMIRGHLATIFDSLFPTSGSRAIEPQILCDMLLLELDRIIDLIALGSNPKEKGPPERRSLAYWLIIDVVRGILTGTIGPDGPLGTLNPTDSLHDDLARIAQSFANATNDVGKRRSLLGALQRYDGLVTIKPPLGNPNPATLTAISEELRVQESLEERWQDLVRTVAPEAGARESIFRLLRLIIREAIFQAGKLGLGGLPPRAPTALPPQFEQSLDVLASRGY